ncbi:hypothetical protein VIGAN_06030900 [Vigna angularis var. angularis]|uniref:Uncharacterized protein n=1 Tax=Vigna angularis var. angularis TaxID=157739 RepID=A0A0S3S952_PHAAN|nr:hypothetical protein VIGAN_06030900 [Vigna angularis var. angularis]
MKLELPGALLRFLNDDRRRGKTLKSWNLERDLILMTLFPKMEFYHNTHPRACRNMQVALLYWERENARFTQHFFKDIAATTYDCDFKSNPWKLIEKFIQYHG